MHLRQKQYFKSELNTNTQNLKDKNILFLFLSWIQNPNPCPCWASALPPSYTLPEPSSNTCKLIRVWWCMLVIPVFRKLRQEHHCEFEVSLGRLHVQLVKEQLGLQSETLFWKRQGEVEEEKNGKKWGRKMGEQEEQIRLKGNDKFGFAQGALIFQ